MSQLSIPSPSIEAFHLGPLTIHIYALCILAGIVVAYISGGRRYQARGGKQEQFEELCALAVIAGIIGGRLYHVITDDQLYFGPGRTWYHCFFIWQGGLGIWGAISLGGLAIWLYCRRKGIRFASVADSLAPGILAAQAIGRLGNWFNQELFGRPTSLPWGLEIDLSHRPPGYLQYATFHPTFLYELVWSLVGAVFLLWVDRRWTLDHGRLFTLYVAIYTFGRFWVERLRIDPAHHVGQWRLNDVTALVVFTGAVVILIVLQRRYGKGDEHSSCPAHKTR
ncbi:prolipoprotein diacylglyceryl transferase [Cutibacterium acnes]